jgi:hypothetical protein
VDIHTLPQRTKLDKYRRLIVITLPTQIPP